MKKKIVLFNFLLLLIIFSYSVYREESYLKKSTFFIKTEPIDPRSLMQGDYMILNYTILREADDQINELRYGMSQGYINIKINPNTRVAELVSVEDELLSNNHSEILIKFTRNIHSSRGRGMDIGINSYMFQEGTGEIYSSTTAYSEVILLRNNKLRLKNLVNENFEKIK